MKHKYWKSFNKYVAVCCIAPASSIPKVFLLQICACDLLIGSSGTVGCWDGCGLPGPGVTAALCPPVPTKSTATCWRHCVPLGHGWEALRKQQRDVELSSPCFCLTEVLLRPAKVQLLQTGATGRVAQKMHTVPAAFVLKLGFTQSELKISAWIMSLCYFEKSCNRKTASGLQGASEVFHEDMVSPSVTSSVAWSAQPERGLGALVCQWVSLRKTHWEKLDLFCTRWNTFAQWTNILQICLALKKYCHFDAYFLS